MLSHTNHLRGLMFRSFRKLSLIFLSLFLINFFAPQGECYQTALITYPEYNKNWKQAYYGKQNDEVISQWIPAYSYSNDWAESVIFHSYNYAKGNSCYKFMMNLLGNVSSKNKTMSYSILKDKYEDSVAIWCADKNSAMQAQCEIIRVTSGYEGLISIHYINKNKENFLSQKDIWLSIVRNVRIYYSYFRWDRVMQKESSVEL